MKKNSLVGSEKDGDSLFVKDHGGGVTRGVNSERWFPFPGLKLEELHAQLPHAHEAYMATENM